jgi:hypothetical protein
MAIFSRRILQRILDENRQFLSRKTIQEQLRKLNRCDIHSLAVEWEASILNILSKIGKLQYEKAFKGTKKPDVHFESEHIVPFIADIAAVSDRDSDKENPRDYLYECIRNYFKKKSLSINGLLVELNGKRVGDYGDQKVKLNLPDKSQLPAFVRKHFASIIKDIKTNPQSSFNTIVGDENIKMKVSYRPGNFASIGGGLDYTVPYSLRRNPVFNALKAKAKKLKQCAFDGPAGVFLCDSDCYGLHMHSRSIGGFVIEDIIAEAFRLFSTLSFIVVLTIEEKHYACSIKDKRCINGICHLSKMAKFPLDETFRNELNTIYSLFPTPCATPENALQMLKSQKYKGYSFLGGGTTSESECEITIPSRALTEILAGSLNYYGVTKDKKDPMSCIAWMKDFFHSQLAVGGMITEISLIKCPEEDDDWIKIKYIPIDPAISKYI